MIHFSPIQFSWRETLLWVLGRRRRFVISGQSMLPTLNNGDFVLINPDQNPKVGDVVLCTHPYKGFEMVKRVVELNDVDGITEVVVMGDNRAHSTDSREFGALNLDQVLGVVSALLG